MWSKAGAIIGLFIGFCLIIFRKRVRSLYLKKHFEEHRTPKKIEYQKQMQEMKLEGIFHKGLEIVSVTAGMFLVLMSAAEFFPQASKYIVYFIAYSLLAFFAAGAAALVGLTLLFGLLWKNVQKYARERYPDWYRSVKASSGSDKLNAVRSGPTDDPVLHALRKRATIHSVICFIALFVIFLFVFYTIFRVTS